MAGRERIRIAWLLDSPGPNTSDFFDALAELPDYDLNVLYCTGGNKKWHDSFSVSDGHRHQVLWNGNPFPERTINMHLNPGVVSAFRSDTHDIAVISGISPSAALAMAMCWKRRRPYVVRGEMINRSGSRFRRAAQAHSVHALIRRADAVFTMGPRGRRSFRELGIASDRIYSLPYSCSLQPYLSVDRCPPGRPPARRSVSTLGQLIQRKRVDLVIDAFAKLAPAFPDWDLRIGGAGPLLEALKLRVPEDLRPRVEFVGFVDKAAQPAFYESADLFVLASLEDGWGMVIPEAMASGLPIVATYGVESAVELLADGGGELVPPDDEPALRAVMRRLMADGSLRHTEGERARSSARRYDSTLVAARAAEDFRSVLECSGRQSE